MFALEAWSRMARLCIVISSLLLAGCNVTNDEKASPPVTDLPDELASLAWVTLADAEKDAGKAIANQDYRLYVVASRGENVPGVDSSTSRQLKQRCGKQYIPGSTDAIKSDQHLAALKQAYAYAAQYNQIMVRHCPGE